MPFARVEIPRYVMSMEFPTANEVETAILWDMAAEVAKEMGCTVIRPDFYKGTQNDEAAQVMVTVALQVAKARLAAKKTVPELPIVEGTQAELF